MRIKFVILNGCLLDLIQNRADCFFPHVNYLTFAPVLHKELIAGIWLGSPHRGINSSYSRVKIGQLGINRYVH